MARTLYRCLNCGCTAAVPDEGVVIIWTRCRRAECQQMVIVRAVVQRLTGDKRGLRPSDQAIENQEGREHREPS